MFHDITAGDFLLSFLIGWISGMVPFCYLLGRIKGKDLRRVGSKNIGATNLGRTCGPVFFIIGFLLDGIKGLVPVLIARSFMLPPIGAGAGALIGHVFNPLFRGKGGKGVSTVIGVALGLVPRAFLLAFGIWLVLYVTTLIVSIASLGLAIALPVAAFFLNDGSLLDRMFLIMLCMLVIIAHGRNIQRLFQGNEPKTRLWKAP